MIILSFVLIAENIYGQQKSKDPILSLNIKDKQLFVDAFIPKDIYEIELKIESNRNENISRLSDISPNNPENKMSLMATHNSRNTDFWYPIVDIELENGMEGVCIFNKNPRGSIYLGTPYYRTAQSLKEEIIIPGNKLDYWENSLFVVPKIGNNLEKFYLRNTYPVILRDFHHVFNLLSDDWEGTISIVANTEKGEKVIAKESVTSPDKFQWNMKIENLKGTGITKERLLIALEAAIKDGMRRQNTNKSSPMYNSIHTFYDMDARTYRTAYWPWGGGPIVKMILDALKIPEMKDKLDSTRLMDAMNGYGKMYLQYQVKENNHPANGSFLVIWTGRGKKPDGFTKWIGTADSGVMIRWVIIPLFKATSDSSYLKSAILWSKGKERLLDSMEIVPHRFLYDENVFDSYIADETGWDPEGHAALYEVTGNDLHRQIGKDFMDKHIAKFGTKTGLWHHHYNFKTGITSEPSYVTRHTGWVMEGLLAMNRMYPNSEYLDYARNIAEYLIDSQLENGSWSFIFKSLDESEISEKGTAFWSMLFYQLYDATGDKKYLDVARKALIWCLDNQYPGPDPEGIGGIFGMTRQSGVSYRPWYNLSCAYTTGFFGLAILSELKLIKQ